jgi:hypothetical protein
VKHAAARFISIAVHPFLTMPLAVAYALRALGYGERAANIVLVATAISLLVVGAYAVVQVRRGKFTNIDVSKREQRPRFYAMLIAATALSGVFFLQLGLPYPVVRGTFISASLLAACFVVNFWLKCSLHVAYTVFPLAIVWQAAPLVARGAGVVVVLLMIWSRVTMRRHTLPETIAGAALAALAGVVLNH